MLQFILKQLFLKLNRNNFRPAFTLVELLVVIAIIGVLAAIIAPNAFRAVEKGKIARVIADLKAIKAAGYSYYADTGDWPTAAGTNGMGYFISPPSGNSNWNGPYLEKLPANTPWGGNYSYWKAPISGTVYDANNNPHSVNNTLCAAVTISNFPDSAIRDAVNRQIRESIGYSYTGYQSGFGYYITVIIWMDDM